MSYLPIARFPVIRIICRHAGCRAVTELAPSLVEQVMVKTGCCCPICGKPFANPGVQGGADVVTQFAGAILALNGLADRLGIELPIPEAG